MLPCEEVHRTYNRLANGEVQAGQLPRWMHVRGQVAWYVFQGSYEGLADAWATFMQKALSSDIGEVTGPPGDVYVCDPLDHLEDEQSRLTTILWAPLKE